MDCDGLVISMYVSKLYNISIGEDNFLRVVRQTESKPSAGKMHVVSRSRLAGSAISIRLVIVTGVSELIS